MLLMQKMDDFDSDRLDEIIDSLLARQVDGILWDVPENDQNREWAQGIKDLPVPIVFVSMEPKPGYSVISIDSYLGAQMATRHLLDKAAGRSGILPAHWIGGKRGCACRAGATHSRQRAARSRHGCGRRGTTLRPAARRRLRSCLPATLRWMEFSLPNDQMALSVLREAGRRGIRVPAQLAVVGFDGIPESAYFFPSLTTFPRIRRS